MASDDELPCPSCSAALAPRRTERGVVWVCPSCGGGASTLGVLRRVAPRPFVNHLWQGARHAGRDSDQRCPSCRQPLSTFDGTPVEVSPPAQVCCRCFLVWLDRATLDGLSLGPQTRSLLREGTAWLQVEAMAETDRAVKAARRDLLRNSDAALLRCLAELIDEVMG